jgi:hypothetical protein
MPCGQNRKFHRSGLRIRSVSEPQYSANGFAGICDNRSDLAMVYQLVDDYLNNGNPRKFNLPTLATEINNYFDFGTEGNAAALLAQKLNGLKQLWMVSSVMPCPNLVKERP